MVPAVAGVRCQRWEISCRGAGRASGAGEEPAMVSDGDVFSVVPPAPILQRQLSLTLKAIPGRELAHRPGSVGPEPLESLHRGMG